MINDDSPLPQKHEGLEAFHRALQRQWREMFVASQPDRVERFLENPGLLDSLSQDSHTLYFIYDGLKFEIRYISRNLEAFSGYTLEEVAANRLLFLFKVLRFEHLAFFTKLVGTTKFFKKIPKEEYQAFYTFTACGLTFRTKSGRNVSCLFRAYPIEIDLDAGVSILLLKVKDVSHLLKSEGFWYRMVCGKDRQFLHCHISGEPSRPAHTDVISDRELEVLRLIADGLQSHEIAERLFVSVSTIEKHRKNMIARLGARDTVALTEICSRAGIL